jgi:hypothetical protein
MADSGKSVAVWDLAPSDGRLAESISGVVDDRGRNDRSKPAALLARQQRADMAPAPPGTTLH